MECNLTSSCEIKIILLETKHLAVFKCIRNLEKPNFVSVLLYTSGGIYINLLTFVLKGMYYVSNDNHLIND